MANLPEFMMNKMQSFAIVRVQTSELTDKSSAMTHPGYVSYYKPDFSFF